MQLGTGTSYACARSLFEIQMFILIHFPNLAAQNAAKQRMTKYHAQKSLSNYDGSVVKSLSPLEQGVFTSKGSSRCEIIQQIFLKALINIGLKFIFQLTERSFVKFDRKYGFSSA